MNLNRRDFHRGAGRPDGDRPVTAADPAVPWQRKIRRLGQTQHDRARSRRARRRAMGRLLGQPQDRRRAWSASPAFWRSTRPRCPSTGRASSSATRDFFGECCAAAKKRGMHVIARMSPDLNWEDAVQAHPEWFQRDAQGNAVHHTEDPRLFRTCMFTTYMTDYMPAIMREINSLYDVDGLFTNAWPPLGVAAGLPLRAVQEPAAGRAPSPTGTSSTSARSTCGSCTIPSPRRRSRRTSISPISAAAFAARRTWCNSAKSASGSSATTRAAAATIRPSGDARCRAACATPCKRARWPPT